jgi:hypothetical protein
MGLVDRLLRLLVSRTLRPDQRHRCMLTTIHRPQPSLPPGQTGTLVNHTPPTLNASVQVCVTGTYSTCTYGR